METIRITNEQIQADNNLVNGLEQSLTKWEEELSWIQKELIEQAILDARAGARSKRYEALTLREATLKAYIREANNKLGKVAERYDVGPLKGLLTRALNAMKR